MTDFAKLLVAVDKSEHSDHAVQVACDLARLSKGDVQLLHVREHEVTTGSHAAGVFEVEQDEDVDKLLEKELAAVRAAGINVTASVERASFGQAAGVIVDTAERSGADAIVMGTRGRSELTALVLGSTAFKVLHMAKCPVLVVR